MTRYVLDALYAAGAADTDPAFACARVFVERCRNFDPAHPQDLDGGFFFSTTEADTNKAGQVGNHFRSYGTTTADGILALLATSHAPNDLYWEGEADNPVPKAFADAAEAMFAEGKKPEPYHGYYFRILKAQGPDAQGGAADYVVKGQMIGGFALVAFPAEYDVSGVKTLPVNHEGVVYEKDLGSHTYMLARAITRFKPGKGWKAVEGE